MATTLTTLLPPDSKPATVRLRDDAGYRQLVGVGGIGTGLFFNLDGDRPLGRNESRPARLLDARDYCKLHIICHYVAVLMGADSGISGFRVLPIGNVGADDAGYKLIDEMSRAGMDASQVKIVEGGHTLFSVCFLYPDGAGGNITSSSSAAATLAPGDLDRYEALLARIGTSSIVLAVPEAPLASRDRLLELATVHGALRVASFASTEIQAAKVRGMFSRIDILALNEDEAGALTGTALDPSNPDPFLARCADILCSIQPRIRLVVSAGRRGAFGFDGGRWELSTAPAVRAVNTAGAGDALIAGIVSALAAGMPFLSSCVPPAPRPVATALDFGVLLAAYSVTSPHTIHPEANLDTLLSFAGGLGVDCAPLTTYLACSPVPAASNRSD